MSRVFFEMDVFFSSLARMFRTSADGYCELDTSDDEFTLVCRDGSLVSVIKVAGNSEVRIGPDFDAQVQLLQSKLASYLRIGTRLVWHFESETSPELVSRMIRYMNEPAHATAKRLGLAIEDLLAEKEKVLGGYVQLERCYLVLYTEPPSLSVADRRASRVQLAARRKGLPMGVHTQNLALAIPGLRESHRALRDSLLGDLQQLGYAREAVEVHDIIREIRMMLDPSWTDERAPVSLPGDAVVPVAPLDARDPGRDCSNMLWPSVASQVFAREPEYLSFRFVRVGGRTYYPLVIAVPPATLQPFDALFRRLREAAIPWRIAFHISGDGVAASEVTLRYMTSLFSTSKEVRAALTRAREMSESGSLVGLRIALCTWVDDDDLQKLSINGSRLALALQGWGTVEVDDRLGDPLATVCGTLPALNRFTGAPLAVAPIEDVAALLPIGRPTSPFPSGSMLLRTPDGKLYPFALFSSAQKAWVFMFYAPQRHGKSVQLSTLLEGVVLMPGLERLPRIGIVDIGTSSSGFISMVREGLPEAQRHLVLYKRLRMVPEDAINPCDTPLGCRYPISTHASFLLNFVTILATAVGDEERPEAFVPAIAKMVIEIAYKQCAGDAAKRFDRGIVPEVDAAIDQAMIGVDVNTTWWEIVDDLFSRGNVVAATLAQRYAVPTMSDIAAAAVTDDVTQSFEGQSRDGQPIHRYVYAQLRTAIGMYQVLGGPTRLDLGLARIVSLDLEDVAPASGMQGVAARQTSLMYMLARHVLGRDLLLHSDHVREMPEAYRPYHATEIARTSLDAKVLAFDELHRTGRSPAFRAQIIQDIREGPKANLAIILLSQMLDDFDEAMRELSTVVAVLGQGAVSADKTLATFELRGSTRSILANLGMPTQAGAHMLLKTKVDRGWSVHQVVNTLGPMELWAFSTTREDRTLRDRLYRLLGPAAARKALAARFPSGSAKAEIERRRAALSEHRTIMTEEAEDSIFGDLIRELNPSSSALKAIA